MNPHASPWESRTWALFVHMRKLAQEKNRVSEVHGLGPQHMRTPDQAHAPMTWESLKPLCALGRPSLNFTWRPGEPGIRANSPTPLVFQIFRKEAPRARKLVELTHRTGRAVPETHSLCSLTFRGAGLCGTPSCQRLTPKVGCLWGMGRLP